LSSDDLDIREWFFGEDVENMIGIYIVKELKDKERRSC
jgi:hypothetical protein